MFNIDITELQKAIDAMKNHSRLVDQLMEPFLTGAIDRKRLVELRHVANFILNSNLEIRIKKQRESPDFIVTFEDNVIGLEHEQLFDEKLIASTNSVSKLIDGTAEVFERRYPNHRFLAEIYLTTDDLQFKKSENKPFHIEIADYIYGQLQSIDTPKPWYIEKVRLTQHSQLSFCYNPGGYSVAQLTPEILNKAIIKKNKLADAYRQHSGIDKHWLLIVTGAISPASYEFSRSQFNLDIPSNFERIYLMEESHYRVWQLY